MSEHLFANLNYVEWLNCDIIIINEYFAAFLGVRELGPQIFRGPRTGQSTYSRWTALEPNKKLHNVS